MTSHRWNSLRVFGFVTLLQWIAVASGATPAWAQSTLGVSLPATVNSTLTQGGAPNFADTFVTPFVSTGNGQVFVWKGQFIPGTLNAGNCGIPVGIQLKVLRPVPSTTTVKVVAEGAVHDPLTALQVRFNTTGCPSFNMTSADAVLQFTESGLAFAAGDIVGVTIMSDSTPTPGGTPGYFYPLVSSANTRLVLRDVDVNETINLADSFTGILPGLAPALFVDLGLDVSIDIKPGSYPNSINRGSAGVIPVAIFSTATFDARTIDPDTLFLAGAPVGMVGKSGKFQCHPDDVNGDNLADLVCQFDTAQFLIQPGETMAEVVGETTSGVPIRGKDSVRIVPD
jgi:hypothetical protein